MEPEDRPEPVRLDRVRRERDHARADRALEELIAAAARAAGWPPAWMRAHLAAAERERREGR